MLTDRKIRKCKAYIQVINYFTHSKINSLYINGQAIDNNR